MRTTLKQQKSEISEPHFLTSSKMRCSECGSTDINYQVGECHCANCGLVLDDSRPDLEHFREGTSKTGTQFVDGRIFKAAWMMSAKEKNLKKARRRINEIASRLSLPKYVKDHAYELYKQAVHKDLCVGRDNNSIMMACLYASCNQNDLPKTVVELTEYSRVDKKHLLRAYALIKRELKLNIEVCNPMDLLPRYATNLGLSQKCLIHATQIMNKIKGTSAYTGKNPKSITGAVLYISARQCSERLSQRQIANHIGVMETTIRKRYKEIEGLFSN